jgi:sensor histidine kinase YesM
MMINPRLQREYAVFIIFISALFAAIIGVTIWYTVNHVLVAEYSPEGQQRHLIVFEQVYQLLFMRLVGVFLMGIILTYGLSIWYMHRVAGPIYRTHQILKQIVSGQLPPRLVEFRKNDYFKEILPDLNRVIELLRKQQK